MKAFFSGVFEGAAMAAFVVFCLLAWFPGGTLVMWGVCGAKRLDGFDWVASAIIPAYGLLHTVTGC